MYQDNRHILWAPENHPSVELLRQYHEDVLPPALQHQLERHLLDCDLCSDVLEGMALSGPDKTQTAVQSINHRINAKTHKKKRQPLPLYLTDWRVAAAILLVMCSTVLVLYYNYNEINRQEQSMASSDTDGVTKDELAPAPQTAVFEIESMAEAMPDTVRPATIAAVSPVVRNKSNIRVSVAAAEKEVAVPDHVQVAPEEDPFKMTEAIPDAPVIAKTTEITNPALTVPQPAKTAFAPEPASVERALAGKAAGVQIRGHSSLSMKQVQGQVLSSDGQPLPGVAVTIKGTNSGVATDANGNFSINLPQDKATLAFSYIGFERQEKNIDASTDNLTVNLTEDNKSLSEVVVTGYGATKTQAPVVVSARPIMGKRAYRKYLEENIRYTSKSEKGRVVVQATVSPAGELQNLQVLKSLCPACDTEALRLIKEGPRWKPATRDGSNTAQQVKITVHFKPQNNE
ncbi:TonB family protein [Pontibacter aydingkolensis]|uniref:TonB family protein n=1 Tax=Pontibacter aydingkolensis TaxID=1911536 RepID=A0ABS7CXZ0_9BACT|nr:TonB family protein [Pontibacter aydingkolensis]MBW7468670.1 TonB family protein [Pontibacter aydingkolensis]